MTKRTDIAGDLRGWLRLAGVFAALLLLGGLAYYVFYLPPCRPARFAVSFSPQGYQTNANGTVVPIFAVSNAEPHKVDVCAGTEFGVNMIDFGGSDPITLEPGERAVLPIWPARAYAQSRPVLQCYKFYSRDRSGRINRYIDTQLMKRKVADRIYVSEGQK